MGRMDTETITTTGSYTTTGWDEQVVSGAGDGPRYAHVRATFTYTGVIEGTSTCDYLLYYDGAGYDGAGFAAPGLERIEGSVHGRRGSVVLRHEVTYGADGIRDTFTVVPGSGTGELAGLCGSGTGASTTGTVPYTTELHFAD